MPTTSSVIEIRKYGFKRWTRYLYIFEKRQFRVEVIVEEGI